MARSGAGPAGAAGGRDRGGEGRRPEERGWAGHGEVRIPRGARAAEGPRLCRAGTSVLWASAALRNCLFFFFTFLSSPIETPALDLNQDFVKESEEPPQGLAGKAGPKKFQRGGRDSKKTPEG